MWVNNFYFIFWSEILSCSPQTAPSLTPRLDWEKRKPATTSFDLLHLPSVVIVLFFFLCTPDTGTQLSVASYKLSPLSSLFIFLSSPSDERNKNYYFINTPFSPLLSFSAVPVSSFLRYPFNSVTVNVQAVQGSSGCAAEPLMASPDHVAGEEYEYVFPTILLAIRCKLFFSIIFLRLSRGFGGLLQSSSFGLVWPILSFLLIVMKLFPRTTL